jgi:hypothetical protein
MAVSFLLVVVGVGGVVLVLVLLVWAVVARLVVLVVLSKEDSLKTRSLGRGSSGGVLIKFITFRRLPK